MYRIVQTTTQYYKGDGWTDLESEAKLYDSKEAAQKVIDRYKMEAEVVPDEDNEPEEPPARPVNRRR